MSAHIEIVPTQAKCEPHPLDEGCPTTEIRDEQCLRYLAPSNIRHYLRLVAANGRILASSEEYDSRAGARRALLSWERAFTEAFDARPEGQPHVVVLDIDGNELP